MKWYPIIRILLYLRDIESKEKNYEESYFGNRRVAELKNTFLTAYDVKEKAIVTPENWLEWVL